ncbi:hypothetical protein Acr_20g0011350 [Actinidia rufa]|uniref:Uncharacterized protein n=1 Tax=Actinidia rufa TaxID=165716 RepID=A0A7J0GEU2_9ERIC|nr:hypothetical protein Acr_20g0011350 [Actinidia rufa]
MAATAAAGPGNQGCRWRPMQAIAVKAQRTVAAAGSNVESATAATPRVSTLNFKVRIEVDACCKLQIKVAIKKLGLQSLIRVTVDFRAFGFDLTKLPPDFVKIMFERLDLSVTGLGNGQSSLVSKE